ncbi:MAG: hypothetical protein ACLP59_28205 [Bryobacteraceae bacterium]
MPDLVKIPMASAEYLARFDRPYVGLIALDRPRIFEAVVAALLPFNFRLTNTELVTAGSLADHKVIFRLPDRGISFQFGAEEYRFGKDGSSWSTAEEDAGVLLAAERALLEGSGAKVESCLATIAMHLQPLAKTREEILAPFVPEPLKPLMTNRHAQTFANHLKWADGDVLLDFSLALANGIFLRLSSLFKGQPPLTDILNKVRSDEEVLFGILGIEEARNA